MFDWTERAAAVAEGSVSPLALVAELRSLDDEHLLELEAATALAVVEITQAIGACVSGISALAIEALTRRECEQVELEREDRRRRGERAFTTLGEDLAIGALAPVVHLTPRTMGSHLDHVRTLVNHLPRTFALVRAGRLDLHRAGAVASEALLVRPQHRDTFDDQVTTLSHRCRTPLTDLTPGGVHRRAGATAIRVDPDSAAARAAAALDERFVRVRPGVDPGVTAWSASLPSARSLEAWAAVEALASQYALTDPSRRIDQSRADALLDLVLAQATIHTTIDLVVPHDPGPSSAGGVGGSREVAVSSGGDGGRGDGSTLPPVEHVGDPGREGEDGAPADLPGEEPGTRAGRCPSRGDAHRTCSTCSPPPASPSSWERHLHLISSDGVQVEMLTYAPTLLHRAPSPDRAGEGDRPVHDEHAPFTHPGASLGGRPAEMAPILGVDLAVGPSDLLLAEPSGDEDRDAGVSPSDDPSPGHRPSAGRCSDTGERVALPTCEIGVRHPRVGIILNADVTAWLADPDTRIRLHGYDLATGAVTVHDPTVYRPNQRLARVVRARDGHCRFPGCTTDAARTQLDHVVRFPDGLTTVTNLACLCSRHHAFKHHSGWTLTMDADGTCRWTTPMGRTYTTHARSAAELVA